MVAVKNTIKCKSIPIAIPIPTPRGSHEKQKVPNGNARLRTRI